MCTGTVSPCWRALPSCRLGQFINVPPVENVVYHEEIGTGVARLGLAIALASVGFAALEAIRGFPNEALGLLIGIVGGVAGLTLWGVSRNSGIRVTADYLQVGHEKFRRSDLDPAFGVLRDWLPATG